MKRLATLLAALGFTVCSYAALPAANDPTLVSVPQLPGGLVAGVTGLYLKSANTNGNLDYAINYLTFSVPTDLFTHRGTPTNIEAISSGYDWGWGANIGYIFPNTGNDINLSYFQLKTNKSADAVGTIASISPALGLDINAFLSALSFLPSFNRPGFFTITSNHSVVNAGVDDDLNQVDLTVGQYIDVGCRLILHPLVGLDWASLDQTMNIATASRFSFHQTRITNPDVGNTIVTGAALTRTESNFDGVGPLAGLDASYYLTHGIGLVGHFKAALLIGNIDSNINTGGNEIIGGDQFPSLHGVFLTGLFSAQSNNTTRIVPTLDAKLGLDYTFVFNNAANSDLTLEAGWQVMNYFNAIDTTNLNVTPVAGDRTLRMFAISESHTTSDLSVNGPYISLAIHL